MALQDRIREDVHRVFLNPEHFAERHTWNGRPFLCVTDEEEALKRRNNNVVDIAWSENIAEIVLYVAKGEFPGRLQPNDHGYFDRRPMKILDVQDNLGMVSITLTTFNPREMQG